MNLNIIRSMIFLFAGLTCLIFPNHVYRFQKFLLKVLHIKYKYEFDGKFYYRIGILFVIIAIGIFVLAVYQGL